MNQAELKKNFEAHGFSTSFFSTKEEAGAYLEDSIKGKTVGFGGSVTAQQLHLDTRLAKENTLFWHWLNPGRQTYLEGRNAQIYICSANGVAETGELVNIDGTGNRVSATLFGPEKVYYLIGSNKIEPDLSSAMQRAKNVAAPKNAMRLNKQTPCAVNADRCYHCNSPERICRATVIVERPCSGMEAELVFIDEALGS